MIKIQTFIKRNKDYIDVFDFVGLVPDERYVEGYIYLEINGVIIMDKSEWDLVDQLWSYIAAGLKDVALGNNFRSYFPDQPLLFKINHKGNLLEFSLEHDEKTSALTNMEELLASFPAYIDSFFNKMKEINPNFSDTYDIPLSQIKGLLKL